ncbi:MAG: hypothetical protein R3E54_15140 [Halioglobus sp.]
MFDSRPIYEGDSQHPDTTHNAGYVREWVERCAGYLAAGHRVYFMMHCPNNLHCPAFAEDFHQALRERCSTLPALPAWPVPRQAGLF